MRAVISKYRGLVSDSVMRRAFPPWVYVEPGGPLYTLIGTLLSLAESYARYARYLRRNDPLKSSLQDLVNLYYKAVPEKPEFCNVRVGDNVFKIAVTDDHIEFLGADVGYVAPVGVIRVPEGVQDFIIYRKDMELYLDVVTSSEHYSTKYPFEVFKKMSPFIAGTVVKRGLIITPKYTTYTKLDTFEESKSDPYFTITKKIKVIDPFHKRDGISLSWVLNDGEVIEHNLVDPATYEAAPLTVSNFMFPYTDDITPYKFRIEFDNGIVQLYNPVSPFYIIYEYGSPTPYISFNQSYDYIQEEMVTDYPDEVISDGTTGDMHLEGNHMVVDVTLNNMVSSCDLLVARLISHAYLGDPDGIEPNESDDEGHYYKFTFNPEPSDPYEYGNGENDRGLLFEVILQRAEARVDLHDASMTDVVTFPAGTDLKDYFTVSHEGLAISIKPNGALLETAEYGTSDFKFAFTFKYVLIYTVEGSVPTVGRLQYLDEVINWEDPNAWVIGPMTAYIDHVPEGYGERFIFTGGLTDYKVVLQADVHEYDPSHPDIPGPVLYASGTDITDLVELEVCEDYMRFVPKIELSFNGFEFRNLSATVPPIRVQGTLRIETLNFYTLTPTPENTVYMSLSLYPFADRTKNAILSKYSRFTSNVKITSVRVYNFLEYIDNVLIEDDITVQALGPVRAYVLKAYPTRLFLYYMGTNDVEYRDFDSSIRSITHFDGYIFIALDDGIYAYDLYAAEVTKLSDVVADRIRIGPDNKLYILKGSRITVCELVRNRAFYNGAEIVSFYPIVE